MAWTMGMHNSAKGMLMSGCRSKESLMTMLRSSVKGPFSTSGTDEPRNTVSLKRSFCSYFDEHDTCENDSAEESAQQFEKKKRLTAEQVKSLEISFEMENKLEPERKQKLASDLGLQPRQVAVWFQNRRARWKAKRMEQDFDTLKSEYDVLLAEREELRAEVQRLTAELQEKQQQLACYHEGKPPKPNNGLSDISHDRNLDLFQSDLSDKTESPGSSDYADTVDGDLSPPNFSLQDREAVNWEVGTPPGSSEAPLLTYCQTVDDLYVYQPFSIKLEEGSHEQTFYNSSCLLPTDEHDFPWLWGN